jgi:hypothetical protein
MYNHAWGRQEMFQLFDSVGFPGKSPDKFSRQRALTQERPTRALEKEALKKELTLEGKYRIMDTR